MAQQRWSPNWNEKQIRQLTADGATPCAPRRHERSAMSSRLLLLDRKANHPMSHPSSSRQHARHGQRRARRIVRHRMRDLQPRHERVAQRERARIVAQLIAASQALVADPDVAALLLDGALAQLLDLWARQAHLPSLDRRHALDALEAQAPAAAWRVRLALQAQQLDARLAHCWALLDLLTQLTTTTRRYSIAPQQRVNPASDHIELVRFRTNGASHVS